MGDDRTVETWLRVTRLRERERELELGRAEARVAEARRGIAEAEAQRERQVARARARVGDEVLSVADLSLISEAHRVDEERIERLTEEAERLTEPVAVARAALGDAARKRLAAERWQERRRAERLRDLDRKDDRQATDRAAQRGLSRS